MRYLYENYEEKLIEEAKILELFCSFIRDGMTPDPENDVRRIAMQSELVAVLANNLLKAYQDKMSALDFRKR